MGDLTKESILKANRQQWSSSSKIEAEGLEWLYNDPTAQQTEEQKLESYLLGESIPGARGELQKTTELEGSSRGSLLRDQTSNRVYEQTLSKFREDPLFIIKKLEMKQKQILDKYSSIANNFEKKKRDLSKHSYSKDRERENYYKDRRVEDRNTRSKDHRYDRHSRHDERSRDFHRRDYRNRSPDKDRNKTKNRSRSRSNSINKSKSPEKEVKKVKGPDLPKKYNPLKYAFGVNDDICPPDSILKTAKRKELEAKSRERDQIDKVQGPSDDGSRLEEMKREGSSHIRDKLENISKMDRIQASMDERDSKIKSDYISSVKKHAFETANMAEMIRRKASSQKDPFNENI